MHNDIETLRSTIIPSTTQCNQAELDGTISITTPTYGSIQPLDLRLKLQGGVGHSMFQPKGFSRPDSWCKGYPFLLPKNEDDAIEYVDYRNYFEKKQLWPTERIRRAVVTYRFTAQVQKVQGYIVDEGKNLILPNTLVITRDRDMEIENILDNSHYKNTGGKKNTNEIESYVDVSLGRIIFNRTNIPRNTCQEYRSVARIESGGLYHSKLDNYAIYQYYRDGERIAVTLSQSTRSCGRILFRTGIPNIYVALIEDHEPFLENKKLRAMEFDEGLLLEAEIRGTMNSIELSTDMLYQSSHL